MIAGEDHPAVAVLRDAPFTFTPIGSRTIPGFRPCAHTDYDYLIDGPGNALKDSPLWESYAAWREGYDAIPAHEQLYLPDKPVWARDQFLIGAYLFHHGFKPMARGGYSDDESVAHWRWRESGRPSVDVLLTEYEGDFELRLSMLERWRKAGPHLRLSSKEWGLLWRSLRELAQSAKKET